MIKTKINRKKSSFGFEIRQFNRGRDHQVEVTELS